MGYINALSLLPWGLGPGGVAPISIEIHLQSTLTLTLDCDLALGWAWGRAGVSIGGSIPKEAILGLRQEHQQGLTRPRSKRRKFHLVQRSQGGRVCGRGSQGAEGWNSPEQTQQTSHPPTQAPMGSPPCVRSSMGLLTFLSAMSGNYRVKSDSSMNRQGSQETR